MQFRTIRQVELDSTAIDRHRSFVTPLPLMPMPPFPEVENVHAGDGWGVMWKPVPQKEDMGPTWPRGYPWDVPQQRWAEDKPKDPKAVQHRASKLHTVK